MSSTGKIWLGSATSDIAAITAENASSSGTPAATREPKAIMRINRVAGSESPSAFARSLVNVSFSSLLELASPNCSTVRFSSWMACTESIASVEGSMRSAASSSFPVIWKSISAVWPSGDTEPPPFRGDLTFCTYFARFRRSLAWSIACRNSGSLIVSVLLWTITISSLGRRPASSSVCSARADSPLKLSAP